MCAIKSKITVIYGIQKPNSWGSIRQTDRHDSIGKATTWYCYVHTVAHSFFQPAYIPNARNLIFYSKYYFFIKFIFNNFYYIFKELRIKIWQCKNYSSSCIYCTKLVYPFLVIFNGRRLKTIYFFREHLM